MSRPAESFSTDPQLPPGLGAIMAKASARQWLVVLQDGRKFYIASEHRARRFAASNAGAVIYPPEA